MKRGFLILTVLVLVAAEATSQSFYRRNQPWAVGGGLGSSSFFGDLNGKPGDTGFFFDAQFTGGVWARYHLYKNFHATAQLAYFSLGESDADTGYEDVQQRNLSFRSRGVEFSLMMRAYLNPLERGSARRPTLNPFLYGGIGFITYNPQAQVPDTDHAGNPFGNAGDWTNLRPLQTEGVSYGSIALCFPVGVGLNVRVNNSLDVVAMAGYRYTTTDYIDDVSTTYQGDAAFTDPLAAALADRRPEFDGMLNEPGSVRGNPNNNDGFIMYQLGLEYYIGSASSFGGNRPTRYRRRGSTGIGAFFENIFGPRRGPRRARRR